MESTQRPVAEAAASTSPAGILPANRLFLYSLLLVITLGSLVQAWRLWPGLIVTELLLVLLPTLFYARATGAPFSALRLNWAGAGPCFLGLVIGVGLFPLALGADSLTEKILGYGFALPESSLPAGRGGTLVFVLALAVFAPFCEEMLFRGYILAAYERAALRPRTAILAVAALCTAYHISPARALGVAVFALATTYVAWRTGSVWPSIAVHVGGNGSAAVLGIALHENPLPRAFLWFAIPAVAAAALCLRRVFSGPPRLREPEPGTQSIDAGQWLPLFPAGVILLALAALEFLLHHGL